MDGRGAGRLDLERHGDLGPVVANRAGPFRPYEGIGAAGNAVQVRLVADRGVCGARVVVDFGGMRRGSFYMPQSDSLSQGGRLHHLGLGNHTRVDVV